jgi:hypothetical protein
VLFENLSNEINSESCKTVFVGNHKCNDFAAHCSVQYGCKTFSLVIETASDVFDDFGFRVFLLQVFDLPFEVVFLFS